MNENPLSNIPPIGPSTGAPTPVGNSRFRAVDPLRLLRRHVVLLIVTAVVGVGLGFGTWAALRVTMPSYTSRAKLKVNGPQGNQPQNPTVGGTQIQQQDIALYIENEVQRIRSHEILRAAIDRPDVRQTHWFAGFKGEGGQVDFSEAIRSLQEDHLRAYPEPGSTLIDLSVSTRNPDDASTILNAVITVYLNQLQIESQGNSAELRQVFMNQRNDLDDKVQNLQSQIQRFINVKGIASLDVNQTGAGLEFANLNKQQTALRVRLDAAKASYQALAKAEQNGNFQPTPQEQTQLERMPKIQRLDEHILDLKESLRAREAQYGKDHRIVKRVQDQINAAQAERKTAMGKELRQLQAYKLQNASQNVESIKSQIAALEPKLKAASARMTDLQNKINTFNDLKVELTTARNKRDRAASSLDQLRLAGARPDAVRVTTQIGTSEPRLSFPKMSLVVPGVAVLVFAAVGGLVYLLELLDQRVKSPQDVQLLPEAALLGVLPHIEEDPSASHRIERIVAQHPTGLVAESFRQVRSATLSRMDRRGYKTLMTVAAQPGSGASVVAYNLATSLALNGRRVLVIDANFRRPAQHTLAGVDNDRGLIDVLGEDEEPQKVIAPAQGPGPDVLPTGEAHEAPPELLESQRFRDLLGQLEASYDMIVIDAPPALLTSDAQLLAKQVDAIAMVVRASRDKRGMVQRMTRRLDGHRADLLGIVLNGVRSSAGGYFRKSYQEFYRYQANGRQSANGRASGASGKGARKNHAPADARARAGSDADVDAAAGADADADAEKPTLGSGRE